MNFLAHLYLSGDNDDLLLGNFVADMVKGRQIESFHSGVIKGIRLHRKIDSFTDSHPVVELSKMRLRNKYRLYSGVVVDMFYDHYLARNWQMYSCVPLVAFVDRGYALLLDNFSILPPRARNVLPQMISGNWLVNYASLESLQQHFEGMARRTPFNSGMEHAVEDLKKYYSEFETEFHTFFPELIGYVEKQGVSNQYHRPSAGEQDRTDRDL